jgi:hypothetical protein
MFHIKHKEKGMSTFYYLACTDCKECIFIGSTNLSNTANEHISEFILDHTTCKSKETEKPKDDGILKFCERRYRNIIMIDEHEVWSSEGWKEEYSLNDEYGIDE